jgi:hypothetical protein
VQLFPFFVHPHSPDQDQSTHQIRPLQDKIEANLATHGRAYKDGTGDGFLVNKSFQNVLV